MRSQQGEEPSSSDLDPNRIFSDLSLLICESRLPHSKAGRTEGPHCPRLGKHNPTSHTCDDKRHPQCKKAEFIRRTTQDLWRSRLPLCIQVLLMPQECAEDYCRTGALLLEQWKVQCEASRARGATERQRLLQPRLLLQAVHSFLCFSQLSAWLYTAQGNIASKVVYKVCLLGEDDKEDVPLTRHPVDRYEEHHFPAALIGKTEVLSVCVESLTRRDSAPECVCACQSACSSSAGSSSAEATPDSSRSAPSISSALKESLRKQADHAPNQLQLAEAAHPETSLSPISPIALPTTSEWLECAVTPPSSITVSSLAENPLFESPSASDNDSRGWTHSTEQSLRERLEALQLSSQATPSSRPVFAATPSGGGVSVVDERTKDTVEFYVSEEEEDGDEQSSADDHTARQSRSGNWRQRQSLRSPRSTVSTQTHCRTNHRKRSQKILFSKAEDVVATEHDASTDTLESQDSGYYSSLLIGCSAAPSPQSSSSTSASALPAGRIKRSYTESSASFKHKTSTFSSESQNSKRLSTRGFVPLHLTGELKFSRQTGLPTHSSPAPLKRNQHSFNYDSSLSSVAGIRSALYADHDSGSSDSESGTSLCKSAPASTCLLGNFEESALNGRIKPMGSLDGFQLDLAASGAFCPPHVNLPVTTFFFNISDDNAPSPYLGHCSLESVGKKGYHLPRKGTVQATLFNPQGTVVKMFVVRYDLSDMPVSSQTFVRQRTFYMPSLASVHDARQNKAWLRYLIHLRFVTSRSGKLYLHTDVRMLFSRKCELDVGNAEQNVEDDKSSADHSYSSAFTFELRSFTEMPNKPKFSARKSALTLTNTTAKNDRRTQIT